MFLCVQLVADLGHSWSGALQEEHGGALLPQRPRRHLCLRRDQPLLLWEHPWVDWGVQPTLCGAPGAPHHGRKQVRSEEPPGGPCVCCPVSCRQIQLPLIWDLSQRPCWEGTCRCYIPDDSLQAEEPQTSETEAAEWEQCEAFVEPERTGSSSLSMLRSPSPCIESMNEGHRST